MLCKIPDVKFHKSPFSHLAAITCWQTADIDDIADTRTNGMSLRTSLAKTPKQHY